MFELVSSRVIVAFATISVAFAAGWYFNGLRAESTISKMKESQAKLVAEAANTARAREHALQAEADRLRNTKDEQIRNINTRLAAALVELRNRPSRSTNAFNQGTGIRPPAIGGTGAFLFREDAEFLTREAARADQIRSALLQCNAQYDEVAGYGRR